jgi:hypothetical protein
MHVKVNTDVRSPRLYYSHVSKSRFAQDIRYGEVRSGCLMILYWLPAEPNCFGMMQKPIVLMVTMWPLAFYNIYHTCKGG